MALPVPPLPPSSPRSRPLSVQTPCTNCRSKHLRCTYNADRCEPCKRYGWTCVRRNSAKKPIQFCPGSRAKYDQAFSPDQVWVKLGRRSARLRFVDETADVIAGYDAASDTENEFNDDELSFRTAAAGGVESGIGRFHDLDSDISTRNDTQRQPQMAVTTASAMTTCGSSATATLNRNPGVVPVDGPKQNDKPVNLIGNTDIRLQAILLRYFAEVIGPRFDLCDNERHFSRLVPQRARSSPTLLNAILTTSARHLTRLQRYRNSAGVVEWQGHLLHNLSEESAVYYHNECIKDLLRLSMDPEQIHNEALLAAAIILRTDEEMDGPLHEGEEDTEVFLGMLNMFINAQVPPVATLRHRSPPTYPSQEEVYGHGVQLVHAPQTLNSPSQTISSPSPQTNILWPNTIPRVPSPDGLRQAAFWVALRQELLTSFMKQRPLNFPMNHCDAFRNLTPAEDVIWADRLVIFCADLLEYCYGSSYIHNADQSSYHRHDPSRWHELRNYERALTLALPKSFEPMCYREPDNESAQIFPEIWHLESCHVTGTTHLELARILLVAFDQSRPSLGPGSVASRRKMADTLKAIVRRLCGIALCNRQSPSTFIEALMGITLCGEYFDDRREQEALLGVLRTMHQEHAFPTGKIEKMLLEAWGSA
ncbi:Zn(II)2Cys6 transcription factor [Aspergillus alliaceus]|uniref:Zn(II)2Cys6 transcription factor n=1 Tax=Petromyces alliaceus TaxID=209559 RepID=UPI0012A67364|nr:uncharacterized protein BDW43DRAFT_289856 [Aspergillus alliaceus]KAB8228946.1 hypothetical protein BDW43DRAFT_289856 [Aspergillus alliaceus]